MVEAKGRCPFELGSSIVSGFRYGLTISAIGNFLEVVTNPKTLGILIKNRIDQIDQGVHSVPISTSPMM